MPITQRRYSGKRLHRGTVLAIVISLTSCFVGTGLTREVLRSNEKRLLTQKANEGSLILASILAQFYGTAGDALAESITPTGTVDSQRYAATTAALHAQ